MKNNSRIRETIKTDLLLTLMPPLRDVFLGCEEQFEAYMFSGNGNGCSAEKLDEAKWLLFNVNEICNNFYSLAI